MMWVLFVVMFVVVRLESIVVSFWCLESGWLCGVWVWPSGVCVLDVILFVLINLIMLVLVVVMFVVVRLESIVVSFWCLESVWLCGGWLWPSGVCVF